MNSLAKFKLKLRGYFEFLTSLVNRRADELAANNKASPVELKAKQAKWLDEIGEVERFNMNRLSDRRDLDNLHELNEELLNEVLFERFCFIVDAKDVRFKSLGDEHQYSDLDEALGYLIVTDKYVTREELFFYKDFLKYVHNLDELVHNENHFFNFNSKNVNLVSPFFNKQSNYSAANFVFFSCEFT
jgi:hypothetical protein